MTTAPHYTASILVADDDPDILEIVCAILESRGYRVRRAHDGTSARAELERELPELAIFDLNMPVMGGMELCAHLKEMQGGEVVPVLILTARDGTEDRVAALDGGADEYMTKPFNHAELTAHVRALLRIRALNMSLVEKNRELKQMQETLLHQERKLALSQMAGSAAHNLGQPLAAITLNAALIQQLPEGDERSKMALAAIRQDAKKMADLLQQLKTTQGAKTSHYYRSDTIIELNDPTAVEPIE